MPPGLDETHSPKLQSWVDSAQAPDTDFPIQNLPFGVFVRAGRDTSARIGVAIGESILDLKSCLDRGLLKSQGHAVKAALEMEVLNGIMSLGRPPCTALRQAVSRLLAADSEVRSQRSLVDEILVPMSAVEMQLPAQIGDYTDFYASIDHATNVGKLMRPDNPLFPNYTYVPIAYHGRASSVVVSGSHVVRPSGQVRKEEAEPPRYVPTSALDFELELGTFIGAGNLLGLPIPISKARDHVFGYCLLNDWSARDIQKWEYQPLGPFLGKNFATTISPWVVTADALAPFCCPARERRNGEPEALEYLSSEEDIQSGGLSVDLRASILTEKMRRENAKPFTLTESNTKYLYWTIAQCVTHHASNGCNFLPGDLLGSGTVSGPYEQARGCLLEITGAGKSPVQLPSKETRRYLEDGDEVIFSARASAKGAIPIGFGEARGRIAAQIAY
jgi:fumarylacetoacetase